MTRYGNYQPDQHWNCFKGRDMAIINQTNIGYVSKDEIYGKYQPDQHWNCFIGRDMAIINQTNIGTVSKTRYGNSQPDQIGTVSKDEIW